MDVRVNKNEKRIEWNVGNRTISIYNDHVLYVFRHGKSLLMVKEKYEPSESGFSIYDKCGNLVISYKYLGDSLTFGKVNITDIKGAIISVDYEEEKRMLVILKELEEIRSLLIYDEQGNFIAEIVSPQGYTFVSLKNSAGNIMVVAQGTNDMTRDSFGRNDWNFVIDFENFYVQKKSITQ